MSQRAANAQCGTLLQQFTQPPLAMAQLAVSFYSHTLTGETQCYSGSQVELVVAE